MNGDYYTTTGICRYRGIGPASDDIIVPSAPEYVCDNMSIIQQIKHLCIAGKYDEAIQMTNTIPDREFAIRAHLLCIEHEHAVNLQKKGKK